MNVQIVPSPARSARVGHSESIPRWSRASRLALGVCTLAMPVAVFSVGGAAIATEPDGASWIFVAAYGVIIAHVMLLAFYVAFAAQNPRLGRAHSSWMLALFFGGPVSIPAYWLIHVWNAPMVGRSDVDEEVPGFDERDARDELAEAARMHAAVPVTVG